jgi:NDP-sugar pyrophosphorylase family protein
LPDTIWFPEDALSHLPDHVLSLLLFPVNRPENFDAVIAGDDTRVKEVQVKRSDAASNWIWGAMKMPGGVFRELRDLWLERGDEYLGTLFNEYIARGGQVRGFKTGEAYVDVGTLNGYREALRLLDANHAIAIDRA